LNGGREFRDGFGPLLPSDEVPFGDIDTLARELRHGDVAAFVVEPIQGKGVTMASDDYWPAVQDLCSRHGTLFVMDEVQAGLGRTGRFFAHEHFGVRPDIITVSKALSGGYIPVGAMLSSAKVSESVFSSMDRAVVHSSTFAQTQLAMVAGLATLQAFDDEDILDRVRRTGESFMKRLAPLVERHEFLHEVRGQGLMIGLVFGEPTSRALRLRWKAMETIRTAMFSQLMVVPLFHRHRILTQVAADHVNIVKLLPPLIAGEEEVEYFVDALDDVLTAAADGSSLFFEFGRTVAKSALRRAGHAGD
jgi:ornithine--oxo-acid transaminase